MKKSEPALTDDEWERIERAHRTLANHPNDAGSPLVEAIEAVLAARAAVSADPDDHTEALSEDEVERHVCCLKPRLCRDDHFHQRDVERILAARAAVPAVGADAPELRDCPYPPGGCMNPNCNAVGSDALTEAKALREAAKVYDPMFPPTGTAGVRKWLRDRAARIERGAR